MRRNFVRYIKLLKNIKLALTLLSASSQNWAYEKLDGNHGKCDQYSE